MLRLSHQITQFASEIITNVHQFFLCRTKQGEEGNPCGFFAPASNWSPNHTSQTDCSWRCPRCGMQYCPGKERGGLIKANQLLVLQGTGKAMALDTVKVTSPIGQFRYYPLWWPCTSTTSLIDRMKEIMADVQEKEIAGKPEEEVRQRLVALSHKHAESLGIFKMTTLSEKAKYEIDWINENGALQVKDPSRKFIISHLLEPFLGARYMMKDSEVALDMQTVARMFLFSRATIKAAFPEAE